MTGGFDLFTCSHNMVHTEQRNITAFNPNAHDYRYTSTTAPTCTATGHDLFTCTFNPTHTQQINITAINPNAHNYQYTSTTAPTCTATGHDLFTCTFNPTHLEQRNTVPINPNAHNFNWLITTFTVNTTTNLITLNENGACLRCPVTDVRNDRTVTPTRIYNSSVTATGAADTADAIVLIRGSIPGTAGRIQINQATQIYLATSINFDGSTSSAFYVPANAVITGSGANINITQTVGGPAINASGNLTIAGTIGSIRGSSQTNSGGEGNPGIRANGNVLISGTISTIQGGNGVANIVQDIPQNYLGGHGINATGSVTITGFINTIQGGTPNNSSVRRADIRAGGVDFTWDGTVPWTRP